MNRLIFQAFLFIFMSLFSTTSIYPASMDIKSEELIEEVFLKKNHDFWNYPISSDYSFGIIEGMYDNFIIPLHKGYRDNLLEYQSKTKFSPASLSRLIQCKHWYAQTTGIYLAVRQDEQSLLPEIKNALKDKDQLVRYNAIRAIRVLDKSIKPEFFIEILKDPQEDSCPKATAISVLTPWIKMDIYPYIKNLSGISDPLDYWIAWSIGYLNIPEGYPALMKMISSDDLYVVKTALESLEKISGAEVLTERIEYYPRCDENTTFSENAFKCWNFYDEIEKRSQHSTSAYVKNIGRENVAKALKDKDHILRRNTVRALTPETAKIFEKELLRLGMDENWRVVFHALPLLASLKTETSYYVIKRQLNNLRGYIRKKALKSAVMHGSEKFYNEYIKGLKDRDSEYRAMAVEGLLTLGKPEAIPFLKTAFAVESVYDIKFDIFHCMKELSFTPETKTELLYERIYTGTLDSSDFSNIKAYKIVINFFWSRRFLLSEPGQWRIDTRDKIVNQFNLLKEPGLYLAEHLTEFSDDEQSDYYNYLSYNSPYSTLPLLIKYLDQDLKNTLFGFDIYIKLSQYLGLSNFEREEIKAIWTTMFIKAKPPKSNHVLRFDLYRELSKILEIHECEVDNIIDIWPEVLKQAKTPEDYPVLIKTMLKEKKEK